MKIWLVILTVVCIINAWGLGTVINHNAGLVQEYSDAMEEYLQGEQEILNEHTEVINAHADILDAHQTAIELQGEKINEVVDYLNRER